jgi:hypothetical protein
MGQKMTNNPLELVHLNEHESHVLQQLQGGSEHIRGKPVITARGLMLHHPQMLKNVLDHLNNQCKSRCR